MGVFPRTQRLDASFKKKLLLPIHHHIGESRMMHVDWIRCKNIGPCHLESVDLESVDMVGVYVIWHGGPQPRVVRVGQGDIARCLQQHRDEAEILAYKKYGELFVTWADVPASKRDGIESYLTETWSPLIARTFPMIFPIAVNSPFD